jgi:hypothetical protein
MGKQIAVVALLALVFGGAGSSALLTRAAAQSKPLSATQHEKRLGPKPTPQWYWHWLHWRLHDRMGNRLERRVRPKDAPRRIPHWAWRRLHFFLLARAAHKAKDGQSTAPTKPSSGSVYFDGRASRMKVVTESGSPPKVVQTQKPANVWSCLCFLKNDISLASDGTYGKAYKVAVATGDTNPWGGSKTTDGAAQMSVRRNNDLGKWDYYALAVKVPSWSGPMSDLYFSTLLSVGYQTSQGDQVALGLYPNSHGQLSFEIHQNSGRANNANGWAAGSVSYKQPFLPVTFGQWQEFVVGVKWATDNTGAVQVYSRTPHGSWSKVFKKLNEPTYLYGTTPNGTFARDGSNWGTVIDKLGLYFNEYGGESETVVESGVTRSSDLATAKSTFP